MFGFVIIFTAFIFDINMGVFEKGLVYIKRLIFMSPDVSMFDIYTSGRFADDSIIVTNMKDIVLHSPVFGYGYGSIKSSDFSLYEVLSLGGLVGVISYLLLFLYLSYLCFSIRDVKIKELYVYVLVITISTSLSAPTITANRINVIFWIIISMAVLLNITQSFLMIDKRTITNNR